MSGGATSGEWSSMGSIRGSQGDKGERRGGWIANKHRRKGTATNLAPFFSTPNRNSTTMMDDPPPPNPTPLASATPRAGRPSYLNRTNTSASTSSTPTASYRPDTSSNTTTTANPPRSPHRTLSGSGSTPQSHTLYPPSSPSTNPNPNPNLPHATAHQTTTPTQLLPSSKQPPITIIPSSATPRPNGPSALHLTSSTYDDDDASRRRSSAGGDDAYLDSLKSPELRDGRRRLYGSPLLDGEAEAEGRSEEEEEEEDGVSVSSGGERRHSNLVF
jgi:hypothetical protein